MLRPLYYVCCDGEDEAAPSSSSQPASPPAWSLSSLWSSSGHRHQHFQIVLIIVITTVITLPLLHKHCSDHHQDKKSNKHAVTMCRPVCIYAAATEPTRRMMNGEAINGHLGKGWKGIVTIFVGSFGAPTGRNPRNWLILRHFKRTFFLCFSWFLLMLPEIFVTPRRFGTLPCSEVESLMPPGPLSPQSLVRPHWET